MNAIDLLKAQHRHVERLLSRIAAAAGEARRQVLFEEMADSLAAHLAIEERLFYGAIEPLGAKLVVLESVEEHLGIKRVLADLLKTPVDDETFAAKAKVLKNQIVHHHSEEEDELFPRVSERLAKEELEVLGERMSAAFGMLLAGHPREQVPAETDRAASIYPGAQGARSVTRSAQSHHRTVTSPSTPRRGPRLPGVARSLL